MSNSHIRQLQNGAALITVLLITTICLTLATAIIMIGRLLVVDTQMTTTSEQLIIALSGAEDWARETIKQHPYLVTTTPLHTTFHNIKINAYITSQQSLFNINSLSNIIHINDFIRILRVVDPQLTTAQAQKLAVELHQSVTPMTSTQLSNATDKPRYYAPHRLFITTTQLRALKGFTSTLFLDLAPYITAIPNTMLQIDVNHLQPPVAIILGKNMNIEQARTLVQCQQSHGVFTSVDNFLRICSKGNVTSNIQLVTQSRYFKLIATATLGNETIQLTSFLIAPLNNQKIESVNTMWRQYGKLQ